MSFRQAHSSLTRQNSMKSKETPLCSTSEVREKTVLYKEGDPYQASDLLVSWSLTFQSLLLAMLPVHGTFVIAAQIA